MARYGGHDVRVHRRVCYVEVSRSPQMATSAVSDRGRFFVEFQIAKLPTIAGEDGAAPPNTNVSQALNFLQAGP